MRKYLKIIYENDMAKEELKYNYIFTDNSNISKLNF